MAMHQRIIQLSGPPIDVALAASAVAEAPPEVDATNGTTGAGPHETLSSPTAASPDVDLGTDVSELLAALISAVEELDQQRRQALSEMQQAAIELALAVAAQIVHAAVDRDEFGVERLVEEAIARMPAGGPIHVALHPDDRNLLTARIEESKNGSPFGERVALEARSDMPRGCCRASSPDAEILSQIDGQFADLRELLLERLDDAQIERRRPQADGRGLRRFPERRETA